MNHHTKRRRLTAAEKRAREFDSLQRAEGGQSLMNYPAIIAEFSARGIPVDQIEPRENVFTFNAWKAKGRHVRKGEKGVAVVTWVPMTFRDKATGEESEGRRPRTAYVFHVSQTDPNDTSPRAEHEEQEARGNVDVFNLFGPDQ